MTSCPIFQLRKIVKHVRSSPQRRRAWELIVKISVDGLDADLAEAQLMLILGVRTRWTSTHQMLRRPIHNRDAITRYVDSTPDLCSFVLSEQDWAALQTVQSWLSEFRQATTEMSTTSKPMLSQTHIVFRGLQRTFKDIFSALPNTVDITLKQGLIDAHTKLSDYYYKFDTSPYYIWAAHNPLAVLDPRVSYAGSEKSFADDFMLLGELKSAKQDLYNEFGQHYAPKPSSSSAANS
ncbi:hypothetical protein DFH08DRAFT_717787 [Mycena albidolilacea]|uniref:Uncharacterized protein n=1 Tax=Mycena albidolilacea TaxID=1033008 RepID=A0AAD6Z922_9AGAR|nr:hypothetical protein DFH08DRAFT_717787 [Mycena albidolilacea]